MKVLYSKNYVERDLYVLEHKEKYLLVYRSSGLNAGRKGRFLPFNMLAVPERATLSGDVPGYIYKEFFYRDLWQPHEKNPQEFGDNIGPFLLLIEDFLSDKRPRVEEYTIETYKDLLPIAAKINNEITTAIGNLKPFDWRTL